jgi:hypothetical protein
MVSLLAILAAGCGLPHGGQFIEPGNAPTVLVAYDYEGWDVPPGTEFFLVETRDRTLKFLEEDASGNGVLFAKHWEDDHGDHFAVWGPWYAIEVLVPKNRGEPAYRFTYPKHLYDEVDGRPIPKALTQASARLEPRRVRP